MLSKLTIKKAAEGLRKKEFSATELASDCLKQIRDADGNLHAYLDVFEKEALVEAQKAEDFLEDNPNSPILTGIPLAIKDNILVGGQKCTAGSKILENFVAPYDATVIEKLKKHGAVFLGKTNLDEFAMGSSTENSGFGPTKNPHDEKRVPGGSSGGSAAAVAADMCLGALGSDTGGSIRQPASFCGVVGLKPTYGLVSRHGLIAMASSLDQIGPLAKTVEDAEIIFSAICGEDDFDSTALKKFPEEKNISKPLRVGLPKEYFGFGLNPQIKSALNAVLKKLENYVSSVEEVSLPHAEYALADYYIIMPAEISSNLARYDGIRYGYSSPEAENLSEVYNLSRAHGFGTEVKRRVILGTYVLSSGYYDAYYLKAQKVRRVLKDDFTKVFSKVDVLIGPTTPTAAFKFGEKTTDPLQMYLADIYTVAVNLAGLPAMSVPIGQISQEGIKLPIGIQLIGRWFAEKNIFDLGKIIEKIR